jgi:hypothetical protein
MRYVYFISARVYYANVNLRDSRSVHIHEHYLLLRRRLISGEIMLAACSEHQSSRRAGGPGADFPTRAPPQKRAPDQTSELIHRPANCKVFIRRRLRTHRFNTLLITSSHSTTFCSSFNEKLTAPFGKYEYRE